MIADNQMQEFRRLETIVTKADGDGLRARWDCGQYMLSLVPEGKSQLPKRVLAQLGEVPGVCRSERTARSSPRHSRRSTKFLRS